MFSIDLILKDIDDPYVRENFSRISKYLENQAILAGNWKFYRVEVPNAVVNFKFRHNLTFTPKDVIILSIDGNKNVDFRFDLFNQEYIVFSTQGPVAFRMLAGSYPDDLGYSIRNLSQVPIGSGSSIPGTLGEISKIMDCDNVVSVGDWVVQSPSVNNKAEKIANNLGTNPIIGIVKEKPTSVTCKVLFYGFFPMLLGRGKIHLSTIGDASTTAPITGNVQHLGISFGDGTILVKPESIMLRRV